MTTPTKSAAKWVSNFQNKTCYVIILILCEYGRVKKDYRQGKNVLPQVGFEPGIYWLLDMKICKILSIFSNIDTTIIKILLS